MKLKVDEQLIVFHTFCCGLLCKCGLILLKRKYFMKKIPHFEFMEIPTKYYDWIKIRDLLVATRNINQK